MLKKVVLISYLFSLILALGSIPAVAQTEEKPVQLALFAPLQIFPEETVIKGVRLSFLYGKNVSVTGFDWDLVNHTTTGNSLGVQFGLVGIAEGGFLGWQDNVIKQDGAFPVFPIVNWSF